MAKRSKNERETRASPFDAPQALEKHVLNESRAIETELRNAKESGQPPNFKRKRE